MLSQKVTAINSKKNTLIAGVQIVPLVRHSDVRGGFSEVFSNDWNSATIEPQQWSIVDSITGTLRGMHLHLRHEEYFSLIRGRAFIGLHDPRPGSPTYGLAMGVELDMNNPVAVIFPRGLIHGWYFSEDSIHLQAVSESYNNYGGDDNMGCLWSDNKLGINWPGQPIHVAPRAEKFGSLQELIEETMRIDPDFKYQPIG
ncbi:MAG: dTDP-4-dehydrorhamnose 3,5-epimerase [Parasphingorhabdus sp.]|jgi:dTDP-4-dehydrorhamnose 3,5-epimerase